MSKGKQIFRPKAGAYQVAYGWRWTEDLGTIVEDTGEQAVIALAKELAAAGMSLGEIRAEFKARGVLNRAGKAVWSVERVRYCVRYEGLSSYWAKRKARLDGAVAEKEAAARAAAQAPAVGLDESDVVRWGEAHLVNRDGSARRYWAHQVEDLRADGGNVIHLDGRDVGKTANLSTLALHYALTTPKGSGLVAAALNGQLLSILEEIEYQFEQNPRLNDAIATWKRGRKKFQRTPYPRIEFGNGSVLYFRPAGAYGEAFRSLHVERIWVDEGAWLSEEAWRALRGCLKSGGTMRVYSTPNGLRNTTYYRLTQSDRWTVFRWPSWLNPAWDPERETELLEFYGGRGSVGWQHEVAGEHGAPSYGAFAPEQFGRCVVDVSEYRKVSITGAELADCTDEAEAEARFELLLGLAPGSGRYWIGGDLGYTRDPTEIVVWEETEDRRLETEGERQAVDRRRETEGKGKAVVRRLETEGERQAVDRRLETEGERKAVVRRLKTEGKREKGEEGDEDSLQSAEIDKRHSGHGGRGLRMVLRVHMESVGYPQIACCLAVLDGMYEPAGIGIDNGGNGMAVVQELLTLDRYRARCFGGRLMGFDFGGVTTIPLPDGTEARKRTKEYMTSLINRALQRRDLGFPSSDREIEDQFLTQTYSLSNGRVVYSKGNDHVIDAVRCMMLAREQLREDGVLGGGGAVRPPLEPVVLGFGGGGGWL